MRIHAFLYNGYKEKLTDISAGSNENISSTIYECCNGLNIDVSAEICCIRIRLKVVYSSIYKSRLKNKLLCLL